MDNAHKINNNRTNDKLFLGKKLNLAVGIRPIRLAIAIRPMGRKRPIDCLKQLDPP